jgi:hypothetical protein
VTPVAITSRWPFPFRSAVAANRVARRHLVKVGDPHGGRRRHITRLEYLEKAQRARVKFAAQREQLIEDATERLGRDPQSYPMQTNCGIAAATSARRPPDGRLRHGREGHYEVKFFTR